MIDIEVVAGSPPGFERPVGKEGTVRPLLRFFIPEDTQGYPLRDLINQISVIDEHLRGEILDPGTGRLTWNTMIVLNGTHVDLLKGLDTPVRAGDRLLLVPFIDGG